MKKTSFLTSLVVATALATSPMLSASAVEVSGALGELMALNPGVSALELQREIESFAQAEGRTVESVAEQVLVEAKQSAAVELAGNANNQRTIETFSSSSGDSGSYYLSAAKYKGDVFYSPASTLFISHGHSGLYVNLSEIVEAPGAGKKSRREYAKNIQVGKGAVQQYVDTTQAKRNLAANYALKNLIGLDYNKNFALNRKGTADKMNCSQLVWAAYKEASKLDLDGNGGAGVYPKDIRDSSLTVTYKTI